MPVVYIAINNINQKAYVGVTAYTLRKRRAEHENNARNHRNGCPGFYRAMRKHGVESFSWMVLSTWDNYEDALKDEVLKIATLEPEYNLTRGGDGVVGTKRTSEWTEKIAAASRGKKRSPETIARCRTARPPGLHEKAITCLNDGVSFPSVKAAASHYGIDKSGITEVLVGRQRSTKGYFFAYGNNLDAESAAAAKSIQVARKRHSRTRLGRENARPVVCLVDGKTYETGRLAALAYGIDPMRVVQLCAKGGKTRSGLSFRYADADAVEQKLALPEQIAKAIQARSEALQRGVKKRSKRVICLDDGTSFPSISAAARAKGSTVQCVSEAIHRNGSAHGHRFAFAEEAT